MAGSAGDSGEDPERWTAIAEGLYSPAVAAVGEHGLLLFARDAGGVLSVREHDGKEWAPARSLGAPGIQIEGSISACAAGDCAVQVFAVNIAGDLLQATWSEGRFTSFQPVGPAPGAVTAAACGSRAVALIARGSVGDLSVKWWNGERWSAFTSLGAPEEDDIFYPGNPRSVPLSGAPVACGGGAARLDVFARGAGGDLLHKWWNGKAWSPFASLGMPPGAPFVGASLACAWRKFRLDVFARAADGKLYTRRWCP